MSRYSVMINGRNFLFEQETGVEAMSFFVIRYVDAANQEEAELRAIDIVRKDPRLEPFYESVTNSQPRLYVEEVFEIEETDDTTED